MRESIEIGRHPVAFVKDVCVRMESGFAAGRQDQAGDETNGVPHIRPLNITSLGELTFDGTKYVPRASMKPGERLAKGEVLFNNTNSTEWVGKTTVFPGGRDSACSNHITRLVVDEARVMPDYLAALFNALRGLGLFGLLSTNFNNQAGINTTTLGELRIPLPLIGAQRLLLKELQAARNACDAKLAQAHALLNGIDNLVLAELGLPQPTADGRLAYAVPLDGIKTRLNAEYYHPERVLAVRAMEQARGRFNTARLGSMADFMRDTVKASENSRYLGLASIEPNTGELTGQHETASGLAFTFQKDDILFSRLRPYLNKVRRAEEPGICSTEFHVIRIKKGLPYAVFPEYLACLLRSSPILAQTRHMMTGNTHPRLANKDVVDLVVPIADEAVQKRIANNVAKGKEQVRCMRAEAAALWAQALEDFESKLLGKGAKS